MRAIVIVLFLAGIAPAASAQSSVFGSRGLGLPSRSVSAHGWGLSGAGALFDPESNQNPAALARLLTVTATFQIVPEWRTVETPAGKESTRLTQFPLFSVGGPLKSTFLGLGVSMGSYTSRDFQLVSTHSEDIRGVPVEVIDTLTSRGGMNDIRVAASYLLGPRVDVGAAFHIITGVNRLDQARVFSDTSFLPSRQSSEISYNGVGFSLGAIFRPSSRLSLAATVRSDGKATVDRDSSRAFSVDLPFTFGAGLQFHPSAKLMTSAQATYKTWSGANSDLLEQGGAGAKNTVELAGGIEFTSDPRRPWRRPIRFGARYTQLPFLLTTGGDQPTEYSVSIGTGARFAAQRGGVDLALEHNWRKLGSAYSESGWLLVFGVSLRPALQQP
ncbi:MAG: hypothetical protein ABI679_12115 [Gemmatimonadota bacterium]